jgi:hypothetical protein
MDRTVALHAAMMLLGVIIRLDAIGVFRLWIYAAMLLRGIN